MTRRRSALKPDLFAHEAHKRKIDALGDPLQLIDEHIDFGKLADLIDDLFPRADASKGGRPQSWSGCRSSSACTTCPTSR